jgi:hypothetical protein
MFSAILTLFLLFSSFECNEHDITPTESLFLENYLLINYAPKWLPGVIPLIEHRLSPACKETLLHFVEVKWEGLSPPQHEEVLRCLIISYKQTANTTKSSSKPESSCNALLLNVDPSIGSLYVMSALQRYNLVFCIEKRLFIDYAKYYTGWDTLPYNLLENKANIIECVRKFMCSVGYYVMYTSDQTWDSGIILSQEYKELMVNYINITHYERITDSNSLSEHRKMYTLMDYLQWNDASPLEIQMATSISTSWLVDWIEPLSVVLWRQN